MSEKLLKALGTIESILMDFKEDFAPDLDENIELSTSVDMAHRQIYNARLRLFQEVESLKTQAAETESVPVDDLSDIRLTSAEKWFLVKLSVRDTGVSSKMLKAQYDRLSAHNLIRIENDFAFISERGKAMVEKIVKLPGMRSGGLSVSK